MKRPDQDAVPAPWPLERFLDIEIASGAILLLAAATALVWANLPWTESYQALLHTAATIEVGNLRVPITVHFLVNDVLMTVFFFVVALEIRRELHVGALADGRSAALPVIAAAGGVLIPAAIYIALNRDAALARGWAVPAATDIAFALGILALLGRGIPQVLRVLLLGIAIVDDVIAIVIIALFYSAGVNGFGLLIAAGGVLLVLVLQRLKIRSVVFYLAPGAVVWLGLLVAHLHPTLAGVVLGLLTPVAVRDGGQGFAAAERAFDRLRRRISVGSTDAHSLLQPVRQLQRANLDLLSPVVRLEAALHPWTAFVIMPTFALANAGIAFRSLDATPSALQAGLGIALGLAVGKPLGIVAASAAAVRLHWAKLPEGADWKGMLLVGCLAGVGFTMSIFIATLAFPDAALLASAKAAVLAGSAVAGILGLIIGRAIVASR